MNFEQKLKDLRDSQNQISKIKKDILEKSNDLFLEFSKQIFQKYPKLQSFGWTQYTPYFNDGDACVFNANVDYLFINGKPAEESDWYSEKNVIDWGKFDRETKTYVGRVEEPNIKFTKELFDACQEIREFLQNFDNDFYLSKFGDHADVTVTPIGISVEECEHD